MENKEIKPEKIPDKSNFIEWYNAVLQLAEIADRRYPVKGTFVWMPYGLQAMKNIVKEWDYLFQKNGIKEVYFPLFVPLEFARINEEWFEGFKDELYYVYDSKGKPLGMALRPTGEPAMYPIFKMWIKDGKLPIKIYQTVSSFRKEGKTTHSMIRDREITFWYEIHTVHKTKEEAEKEMQLHIDLNFLIWKEVLNIPPIIVEKPKYEIFPGAISAVEFYSLLPNGRLLENGSVNNLGQAYAKKFDLYYVENGKKEYCWQICTGNGARYLVAVIALHGDERGLVLPPRIAPIQAVIIPIYTKQNKQKIIEEAKNLEKELSKKGIRAYADINEKITPGEKFNLWDIKGVPIRIEIGQKELETNKLTVYRRDLKQRTEIKRNELAKIKKLLQKEIPQYLYARVQKMYEEKIKYFDSFEEALEWIKKGGVAKANWCGSKACYMQISLAEESAEPIGMLLNQTKKGKCIVCGKQTEKLALIGKVY